MSVTMPLSHLHRFSEKHAQHYPLEPCLASFVEGEGKEISNLNKGFLRPIREDFPGEPFTLPPGAEDDCSTPRGSRHGKLSLDGFLISLVRERFDEPRCPQDRDPSDDPQARIQRVPGQFQSPWRPDFNFQQNPI